MRPVGGQKPFSAPSGESRGSQYKDPTLSSIGDSFAKVSLPFKTSNTASAPNPVESSHMDFGLPRQNIATVAEEQVGAPKTRVEIPDNTKLPDIKKPESSIPQQALANKNSKAVWQTDSKRMAKNLVTGKRAQSPLGENDKSLPKFKNYLEARTGDAYQDPNAGNPIYYNRFGSIVQPMALPGQERGAYPILSKLENIQGLGTQSVPSQAFDVNAPLIDLSSPKKSNSK